MMVSLVALLALGPTAQSSPLAQESKLQNPLEVRAEAESVHSFLERLSKETGTTLKASPSIKDDLIVLYSDEPVYKTLDQIAKHFSWTWQKAPAGEYVLGQTSYQSSAEKQARDEQILLPYLRWQNEAKEALKLARNLSNADRERITTLSQELQKHYEDADEVNRKFDDALKKEWTAKFIKLENERQLLSRKLSLTWRASDEFVASLSRQQLLQLDEDGKIVAAYRPGRLQYSLPPNVLSALDDLVKSLPTVGFDTSSREEWQRAEILRNTWLNPISPEKIANVLFIVDPLSPIEPDSSSDYLPVRIAMRHVNGTPLGSDFLGARIWQDAEKAKEPPHTPDLLDEPTEMTDALKSAIAEAAARKGPLEVFRTSDSLSHPAQVKARIMIEIAKATKVDLISDCYDTSRWVSHTTFAITPPRKAFQEFTKEDEASWTFDQGWVSIRSKYWQLTRASTFSLEKLIKIRDLLRLNPLSFDSYAEAIAQGSIRQLRGTISKHLFYRSPLKLEPDRSPTTLHTLRLWGSLSRETRKSLLAGSTLRYGSLNPSQQSAVRLFILHTEDLPWTMAVDFMEEYPPEKEEVEWLKKNWKATLEQYRPIFDATEYLPQGISPDTEIGFRKSSIPAVVASNARGWSMSMSEVSAIGSGYLRPDSTEFLIVPTLQDLYTISVWTPEKIFGRQIALTHPAKGDPKPLSQLPEEIQTRVRDAMKKRSGGG